MKLEDRFDAINEGYSYLELELAGAKARGDAYEGMLRDSEDEIHILRKYIDLLDDKLSARAIELQRLKKGQS